MDKTRRDRITSFVLLPAVLVAVGVLAYFTFRTTFQVDKLRQQSVLEATLGLANEKADRLDKQIVLEDNVVFAIADPNNLTELTEGWLPTAQRETPTVRAIFWFSTKLAMSSRSLRGPGELGATKRPSAAFSRSECSGTWISARSP